MRSTISQRPEQAPRAATTTRAAENAELDARLEIAAKKEALRSMEAQAGGPASATDVPAIAGAPMPPVPSRSRTITIEKDGKTIVLENPSPEQLRQVGVGGMPAPEPGMIAALTVSTLGAIVLIVWMVLNYLKRGRGAGAATGRNDAELAAHMARIENAIESVAVEVERISEGQRFTSRLLSEGAAAPVNAGAHGEGDRLRRNGEL